MDCLLLISYSLLQVIIILYMSSKTSLLILLLAGLLATIANGLNWQGAGNMNSSVIAKIWDKLVTNILSTLDANTYEAKNAFVKDISDRLNLQWNPAWNVVYMHGPPQYDAIFYGYAFNDHWMWYNGVAASNIPDSNIVTLIVWKDYNCQNWKHIGDGDSAQSTFTVEQKSQIAAEIPKITQTQIINDIWGVTYTLMTNLQAKSDFSSGGYTIIMSQFLYVDFFGYVCRVGDSFYYSYKDYGQAIIPSKDLGLFYLFQTR